MSDNKTSSGGIGFTGALLIAFIVLKLCNVINWSWWWVLSPAWIVAGIVVLLLAILGMVNFIEWRKNKKVVNKQGQIRSKWQERLDQMKEAQAKAEEFRAQNKV